MEIGERTVYKYKVKRGRGGGIIDIYDGVFMNKMRNSSTHYFTPNDRQ
jgi:hypothetical protein